MSANFFCVLCNREVQILSTKLLDTKPDGSDEMRFLSCGHTSKLVKRQIIEELEFAPKVNERITATVSGAGLTTFSGDLNKIDIQRINEQPQTLHIHLNNIINTSATNQNYIQNCSINNIMTCINQTLSALQKSQVEGLVREFEEETKKTRPEEGRLKSIINRVIPIATDVGLMLLKHGLEKGLFSGPILSSSPLLIGLNPYLLLL